jgi:putative NADH-flavin reductase
VDIARRRGHDVVAVVRSPRLADVDEAIVGDVTDIRNVRDISADADVVVNAVARLDVDATAFYTAATRALLEGAGSSRLVAVGMGALVELSTGVRLMDTHDYPAEYLNFARGRARELEMLSAAPSHVNWVFVIPPPVMLDEEADEPEPLQIRAGHVLPASSSVQFSFADLASAVLDVAFDQSLHRTAVVVSRR